MARIRCSICGTLVKEEDAATACPDCEQSYHTACWDEIGGCATYGCKSAAEAEKAAPPPRLVGAGWGDEKECPACSASIPSSRLVCRCGATFPWADPMTPAEYESWIAGQNEIVSTKRVILALFLASLLGPPAPLTGAVGLWYARSRKGSLHGADATYVAMAYGGAALGAVQAVTLLLLALGR
jgi:hypothetical protein